MLNASHIYTEFLGLSRLPLLFPPVTRLLLHILLFPVDLQPGNSPLPPAGGSARPQLTFPCDLFMSAVKRWEPSASQALRFLRRCRHSARQMSRGRRRSRVHTSCGALSLPCSLVSVCPGKQNHGDLFRRLQRLPKKAQPFSLLYFSGGKVVTSPWWFSQSVRGLTVASPASPFVSRSARSHHCSPAGPRTEYYSLCISENRPPWRRRDLESAVLQSQVFLPCNRRRLLHSAEKVLTGRGLLFVFPAD